MGKKSHKIHLFQCEGGSSINLARFPVTGYHHSKMEMKSLDSLLIEAEWWLCGKVAALQCQCSIMTADSVCTEYKFSP